MRKGGGESGPRNDTGALLKEQNHNFAEWFIDSKWIASGLNDLSTASGLPNIHR